MLTYAHSKRLNLFLPKDLNCDTQLSYYKITTFLFIV